MNEFPRIYLSGPMQYTKEGKEWREVAKDKLKARGFEGISPYDFERVEKGIVERDLSEILNSFGIIVNAYEEVPSWGTPMEVFFAYTHGKTVIAFVGDLGKPTPIWLSHHSVIVLTLDDAIERITWGRSSH